LARDERAGTSGLLSSLFFLRGYRCIPECGWRGLRFSRSRFRAGQRRLKVALIVMLFLVAAAATVNFVLSRSGLRSGPAHDGVEESG
jgi:hypothetical protein